MGNGLQVAFERKFVNGYTGLLSSSAVVLAGGLWHQRASLKTFVPQSWLMAHLR
jgi:hypothetical protein